MSEMCDLDKYWKELKNDFKLRLLMSLNIEDTPAELRKSPYDFVHNWGDIENIVDEVIDGIPRSELEACGGREEAEEFLEAVWQEMLKSGKFENLPREVEEPW